MNIKFDESTFLQTDFSSYKDLVGDEVVEQLQGYQKTVTSLVTLRESMNKFAAGIGTIYSATTTQLQPAASKILDGSRDLYAGTKDLKDGTEELLDGTVELKDGTAELLDGTVDLKDGVQDLYDGSIELRDGMEEFDEDGIQKLYDMICTDMQKVIDRARAVTDAGKAYQSFTQIAPGMKGSVKFLIETDAIK
jgi:putative membrane protein